MDFCLIFVPFGHYDGPEILPYENTSICPKGADVRQFQEVANGNAHAIMAPYPKPNFYEIQYKGVLIQPFKGMEFNTRTQGMAVRKGDPDILNFFDHWIRRNADFINERREYWFNSNAWWDAVEGSPTRPKKK
jgi:polar amino acid transport system substrate-binding protein